MNVEDAPMVIAYRSRIEAANGEFWWQFMQDHPVVVMWFWGVVITLLLLFLLSELWLPKPKRPALKWSRNEFAAKERKERREG